MHINDLIGLLQAFEELHPDAQVNFATQHFHSFYNKISENAEPVIYKGNLYFALDQVDYLPAKIREAFPLWGA